MEHAEGEHFVNIVGIGRRISKRRMVCCSRTVIFHFSKLYNCVAIQNAFAFLGHPRLVKCFHLCRCASVKCKHDARVMCIRVHLFERTLAISIWTYWIYYARTQTALCFVSKTLEMKKQMFFFFLFLSLFVFIRLVEKQMRIKCACDISDNYVHIKQTKLRIETKYFPNYH